MFFGFNNAPQHPMCKWNLIFASKPWILLCVSSQSGTSYTIRKLLHILEIWIKLNCISENILSIEIRFMNFARNGKASWQPVSSLIYYLLWSYIQKTVESCRNSFQKAINSRLLIHFWFDKQQVELLRVCNYDLVSKHEEGSFRNTMKTFVSTFSYN